ncbi:hypothetical protein KP509_01G018700 [Ceratopteris richardii]|nr:hypothetical protein KP509_01G018700 [Ceratopteris richardii]
MRPPSMAAGVPTSTGVTGIPFLSFDLGTAPVSGYGPPSTGGILHNSGLFEEEAPLLEELGIDTSQIMRKTRSVLNPFRLKSDLHEDADLSGPFVIFMLFGLFQLLAGKLHFGVILGWLAVASIFIYFVFNMLAGSNGSLDLYRCLSIVGYCLLPMVIFSGISLFLPRSGLTIAVISCIAVIWCTRASTGLLVMVAPHAEEYRSLLAYSCGLLYTAFSLLVLF